MRYVLDTDIITALQHNHQAVVAHVEAVSPAALFVTIVSVEEQIAGRLHALHGQLNSSRLIEAYQRLLQTIRFYSAANILSFDQEAAQQDAELRRLHRRMGTKDRRIAAIALVSNCTLVTRNILHFQHIVGLALDNWIDAG